VLALFASDAPLGVDLFLVVMLLLIPTMLIGIRLAATGRVQAHGRVMGVSFVLFVAALLAFEWAVRTMENRPDIPVLVLTIHLCFAIPGLALWTWQIIRAKKAPTEPKRHARRGKIVFALLVATVATGVWMYGAMFG
jgi:uncharacterized membrane protein YozB (DUF420 family)